MSVGLLAVAGTVGAITSLWFTESVWIVLALTVSGVLAVVFSSVHCSVSRRSHSMCCGDTAINSPGGAGDEPGQAA